MLLQQLRASPLNLKKMTKAFVKTVASILKQKLKTTRQFVIEDKTTPHGI